MGYKGKYLSLYGEDFLLEKLFEGKSDGFFVEVGCIDGLRFSNTFYFESIGWNGICVEAHSDYIDLIKKNRSSKVIHAAIGDKSTPNVDFYANSRGTFSSLGNERESEWTGNKYFTGFELQKVDMITLGDLFKDNNVKHIDILSIDIEGFEVEAVSGMDFSFCKPTVIVVESDSPQHKLRIEAVLLKNGYHYITALRNNLFYSQIKDHIPKIRKKVFNGVEIIHTSHPLDDEDDCIKKVTITTR